MKRTIAFLTLLLCCTSQPRPSGQGGAQSASSMSAGGAPVDGGTGGHGGAGGKDWDGGGEGGWIEQADTGPYCGLPNGGIGICVNPGQDCPPETACWSWTCFDGHCVAVPKF